MDSGAYHLVLNVTEAITVAVGRLGRHSFARGQYVYTGSAMKGLCGRVKRHLNMEPEGGGHWHIDSLLSNPHVTVVAVILLPSRERQECMRNRTVLGLRGCQIPVAGFGATDCTEGCVAHLAYFPEGVPASRLVVS